MEKEGILSQFELSNGLKVVHQKVDRPIAHCGLMINVGSRDELKGEEGLAHFIEHAIFKGTGKRRTYHILNRLDSVGGELDAFTTKEMTCYYASFLSEYYERAIELISDISLNSIFPAKELEKEKMVVMDEIATYMDSPADQIYDDFESQVFQGHPLGNPILGNADSLASFDRELIESFMQRLYLQQNMVFTSVGNISAKRLQNKLEKHFSKVSNQAPKNGRQSFSVQVPKIVKTKRDSYQTHCIMGKSTFGSNHPNRMGMSLLNNILGGPAMNSILNIKIREKYGYTYNIESNYSLYSDSGLFSIYLASDPKYINSSLKAVKKELSNLRENKLSRMKLKLAKQQLKGQIAIGRESNSNRMLSNGKSLLMKGVIKPLEEIYQAIDNITAEEIQDIAQSELNSKGFDFLFFEGK